MDLEVLSQISIGDVLERVPHHFAGKYIPAIHTATVESFSVEGVYVRSLPDRAVYHVSLLALVQGWWKIKTS